MSVVGAIAAQDESPPEFLSFRRVATLLISGNHPTNNVGVSEHVKCNMPTISYSTVDRLLKTRANSLLPGDTPISITSVRMAVLSTLKSSVNPQAVAAAVTLVAGVGLYVKVYGTAIRT